jgi:hypothetical protein
MLQLGSDKGDSFQHNQGKKERKKKKNIIQHQCPVGYVPIKPGKAR